METMSDYQALLRPAQRELAAKSEIHTSMASALADHCALLTEAFDGLQTQVSVLTETACRLAQALLSGQKVLVAGNGGSAAQAQHFAAELVGRFKRERSPYPVMALTTDTAILTALANDYGYEDVFARQVRAFGHTDDLLIVFSTSGESENLMRAVQAGQDLGMFTTAVLSKRRCRLERLVDLAIRVPVRETAAVQELHMIVIHLLCDIVEARLYAEQRQNLL